jgi:uncharacterized phage protein (TIGR01671 family)
MREIKFRAWDVGRNMMWYEDTKTPDGNEISFHFYNTKSKNIGWGIYDNKLENRLVTGDQNAIFNTPGILMQYTGLKDKNGNEIYEGDVCKVFDSKNLEPIVIIFKQGAFGYISEQVFAEFISLAQNRWLSIKDDQTPELEIISNIYQKEK